jgi:hypothetical protein
VQLRIDQLRGNANIAKMTNNLIATANYLINEFDQENSLPRDLASFQQILVLPTLSQPVAFADEEALVAIMIISQLLTSEDGDWIYELLAKDTIGLGPVNNLIDVQFDLSLLNNDIRHIVETSPDVIAAVVLNNNGIDNEGLAYRATLTKLMASLDLP